MKTVALAITLILVGTGASLAGAGAPVPEGSQIPPPSGRPSDDAKCEGVWKMAAPSGDTLDKGKAVPFVVNFQMVDTDNNGSISQAEFKAGCAKGWIQEADAATVKDMKKE
jgi:hypothetical protein